MQVNSSNLLNFKKDFFSGFRFFKDLCDVLIVSFQVVDKLPKAGGTGSRTKFENTFKDLNESLDIEDSQDTNNKESRSVLSGVYIQ